LDEEIQRDIEKGVAMMGMDRQASAKSKLQKIK